MATDFRFNPKTLDLSTYHEITVQCESKQESFFRNVLLNYEKTRPSYTMENDEYAEIFDETKFCNKI